MKLLKTIIATGLLLAGNASAMSYEEAKNMYGKDAAIIMNETEFPVPYYEGATTESVSIEGTLIVYKVVTQDITYFPDNLYGPTTEALKQNTIQALKDTFCSRPYINDLPVTLVMHIESGADRKGKHDSIIVNTKDHCK